MRPRTIHPTFVLLVTALLMASGCKREQPPVVDNPPQAPEEHPGGPFTTKQTPDGQPLVATFPGKPEWTDVPGVQPATKGFVWRGDDKSKPHAVWVWAIPPEERAKHPDAILAETYARKAACVGGSAYFFYGQDPRGGGVGGWQSRAWKGQEHDVRPEAKDSGAGTVRIVGDKAYCLRILGSELAIDDPDCKAFFDSLQPAEWNDRPATAKAPDDDLRPLARDGQFRNLAAVGTHSTGIAILPERGAVFRSSFAYTDRGGFDPAGYKLTRSKYPTFQPDGEYKFPSFTDIVGADAARNRLYLRISDKSSKLARFDVPEKLGAGKQEQVQDLKAMDITGSLGPICIAPDGRDLYALRYDLGKRVVAIRIAAEEMKETGVALPLEEKTSALCLSPDGKTLYAGATAAPSVSSPNLGPTAAADASNCLVQEIRVPDWKVQRSFKVRGTARSLRCGADGRLYLSDSWCWIRVNPTLPGEPKVQLVATNDSYGGFLLSPNARRLYALSDGSYPYSLDVKELFDHGRFVIAPEYMTSHKARTFGPDDMERLSGSFAVIGGGIISPDGKCLWLNSGHAFWLTGGGPLPEADPAVKWQPVHEKPLPNLKDVLGPVKR